MTINLVDDLLAASLALLEAEECLLRAGRRESESAYDLAATVMRLTRDAIEQALDAPGNPQQLFALLRKACRIDGVGSPLVSRTAAALAECAAA